jgi:hypothetical protein
MPLAPARSGFSVAVNKRRPAPPEQADDQSRADPDHEKVAAPDGEDVAEEIPHQIHAHAGEEGHRDKPAGERGVGEHAEQRVHGDPAPGQARHGDRHRQRHQRDAEKQRQIEGQRQRDAEDRRMRRGVAEIGHPPPHDEAPERPRGQRDADARQRGAGEEIVQHQALSPTRSAASAS